ncbi:MAG: hypothetical protein ABH950_09835 [Candidatus Altiarchaeota archaeon]
MSIPAQIAPRTSPRAGIAVTDKIQVPPPKATLKQLQPLGNELARVAEGTDIAPVMNNIANAVVNAGAGAGRATEVLNTNASSLAEFSFDSARERFAQSEARGGQGGKELAKMSSFMVQLDQKGAAKLVELASGHIGDAPPNVAKWFEAIKLEMAAGKTVDVRPGIGELGSQKKAA